MTEPLNLKKNRRPSSRSAIGPIVALVLTICTILWIPTLFKTVAAPSSAGGAPAQAPAAPDNRVVLVAPRPPAIPKAQPAPSGDASLVERLNASLPGLGVSPPARIAESHPQGDRIVLVFNAAFRKSLNSLRDVSALDELTGALSHRVLDAGFKHLELRVLDDTGRSQPVDELVQTPPERRPRPEPIDDGVRK